MSTQQKTFTGSNVEEILNWVDKIQVGATVNDDKWLQVPAEISSTGRDVRVDIGDFIVLDTETGMCSVE